MMTGVVVDGSSPSVPCSAIHLLDLSNDVFSLVPSGRLDSKCGTKNVDTKNSAELTHSCYYRYVWYRVGVALFSRCSLYASLMTYCVFCVFQRDSFSTTA